MRHRGGSVLRLLASVILIVSGLSACSGSGARPQPAPRPTVSRPPYSARPNIVFVLTDDLSSNLLPYMPHVVALARQGMSFANYTVTDSYCCPSRASIITGRFPHNTRIFQNGPPTGGFPVFHQRGEERATFATALQGAGYRTAMLGKYLNGYHPNQTVDQQKNYVPPGWSTWGVAGNGYPELDYALNQDHQVHHYGKAPADYLTTVLGNLGRDFIVGSVADRRPFFLELATFAPHAPFVAAAQDRGTFAGLRAPRDASFGRIPTAAPRWLRGLPPLGAKTLARLNVDFAKRVEAVQSVDRTLGDLQSTLRSTGQLANTVVVFSSDNGFHLGEHGLSEGKLTAYDTDVRVPLVIAGPGIAPDSVNRAVVQNVDLAPTFEALGRAPVPRLTDGRSLVALLQGTRPPGGMWRTLATVEHHQRGYHGPDPDAQSRAAGDPPSYEAMRSASALYVHYIDGSREYYDLRADPLEVHNRIGGLSRSRIAGLDRQLAALTACRGAAACEAAAAPTRR